ncbi:hypothetical protein M422DRAFT_241252 [Sphaerobolus stellatus SS14]|nr:hypothetical protein M422DRAFT_241252 [Sphaerobolus stellatus SS14]
MSSSRVITDVSLRKAIKRRHGSTFSLLRLVRETINPWTGKNGKNATRKSDKKVFFSLTSLPDEVLAEIFICCLPIFDNCFPNQSGSCRADYLIYPTVPKVHPRITLATLSRVCSRWRRVVFKTPLLWTTIVWDSKVDVKHDIKRFLKLSRGLRLDVFVRQVSGTDIQADLSRPLALLKKELGRVRTLIGCLLPKELAILFPRHTAVDMSRAKLIDLACPHFWFRGSNGEQYHPPRLGRIRARDLTYLTLYDIKLLRNLLIPPEGLKNLVSLYLESHLRSPATYINFLASCPNLEDLFIYDYNLQGWHNNEWPDIRYTLPKLARLGIIGNHNVETVFLCRSLHMPKLEQLEISGMIQQEGCHPYTSQLYYQVLRDSSKSLWDVVLNRLTSEGMALVVPQLRHLVNLVQLKFHEVDIRQGTLDVLLPKEKNGVWNWPCPRLTNLTFKHVDIEDDTLIRLIKVRCPPSRLMDDGSHAKTEMWDVIFGRFSQVLIQRCSFSRDRLYEDLLASAQEYPRIVQIMYSD